MKVFPKSAEAKLGFDVLRARLDTTTRSALGQDRLERMQPARTLGWLQGELARVAELQEAFRFDDPVPLDHVLDVREVIRQAAPEGAFVGPEDLLAVRLVLVTLRRLRDYFARRQQKFPQLAARVARITALPDLEEHLAGIVDDEGRLRDDASPELRRLRRLIVQRQNELREALLRELRKAVGDGYATEEQPTLRNGRMVIPIRAEAKRKVQGFVQDTSATGQTVYIEPASCLDLNNEVRELEAEERREIERILREATARLRAHTDALKENLSALADFDLLQAKATLANEIDGVVPGLNEDGIVDIREGRNPVLLLHFKKLRRQGGEEESRAVVPLDLTLGEDFRTLVITGPNAGGKTVAMKTVGLFALMLAYGLPIPVDPLSRFSLFSHLIVDLGDEQSIEEDLSTFSSHVANLKYMLREADASTLVLIDEAGTGTDPAEGGALAQAVLERLTEVGARTIATTHHGTLKVFAHEAEGVENGSMQFDQATLSPTYRFQPGIPGSSFAFDIARRIGLQKNVLQRARALVGRQKTSLEELIIAFEARNQALGARLEEAETVQRKATHAQTEYEDRLRRLRKEQDEIRRQALEEAERTVREANAQIERTIREIKEAEAAREATKEARAKLEAFKEDVQARREKTDASPEPTTLLPKKPTQPKKKKAKKKTNGQVAGPIAAGDQVVLDGGATAAEVMEIGDDEAVIAFDSMKMRVALHRLSKVGGKRKQQITVRQVQGDTSAVAALSARTFADLRGQRVEEALQEVTRLIDEAVAANLDQVEILHGKGTGALREAIHDYLATRPDVAGVDDAPPQHGGAGVTYVSLR